VDLVVTLGRDAVVEVPAGVELQNWDTDELSMPCSPSWPYNLSVGHQNEAHLDEAEQAR
jgi:hypothetical protein